MKIVKGAACRRLYLALWFNYRVTPNTVQKSFEQLEQQNVIYSRRGAGWYVSDNVDVARQIFEELVHTKTVQYLNDMEALGLGKNEIMNIIKEFRYE